MRLPYWIAGITCPSRPLPTQRIVFAQGIGEGGTVEKASQSWVEPVYRLWKGIKADLHWVCFLVHGFFRIWRTGLPPAIPQGISHGQGAMGEIPDNTGLCILLPIESLSAAVTKFLVFPLQGDLAARTDRKGISIPK